MEKRIFSTSFARHGFIGWLFVLSFCLSSFTSYAQAPAPTGLSVASLTQTTALVSWECEPSPDREEGAFLRYDYVVSTNQLSTALANSAFAAMTEGSDGVLRVGRAVEMEASQLQIDDLSTGTMYYMLIRQNAEDIYGGTSSWVALSFNTLCGGVALPIVLQTFDAASMPACWVGAGENVPVLQSAYKFGDSGNALKLESTAENYSYLFSPVILGSSSASELAFKIYATGSARQRFSVGVAGANDIMNYVPIIQDSIEPGEWYDISAIDATGFFTDNYVWVIYAEAGTPSVFYVDNVEVHDKPACVRPQGLNVTNVTATGATFAWTPQGTETAWNLELTAEGSETPIVVPVTVNPFTYEVLNEATTYSVRVQADCGSTDGQSEWSTPITFTTPQMPLPISSFTCDFEGNVGWNLLNGTASNAWVIGSAVNNGGGTKALYISNDGGTSNSYTNTAETNVWATRLLEVTEEGDYLFSFDWKGKGESSFDYLAAVLVPASVTLEAGSDAGLSLGSSVTIPDGWISLSGTTRLNQSDAWQTCVSEQHLLPGQYNLAFFWENDYSTGSDPAAAVDNVSITKILCPKPQLPTLSGLTANGATLVFADDRTYNVKVFATQPDNPATDETAIFTQNNVSTQCPISGLTETTTYYAYVQAVCDDANSEWVGPLQITTLCEALAATEIPYENGFEEDAPNFPECWTLVYSDYDGYPRAVTGTTYNPAYEGESSLYSTYYAGSYYEDYEDAESFNAMVALPGVADDVDVSGLSINFYMKGYGADIIVGVMTDPADKETFTEVERISGTSNYEEYYIHFTSYAGNGKYIALKYDSVFANVNIDNMRIITTPTCFKPTSFSVKDIMSTEATVEVVDVDHTNAVDVEYGLTGFLQGSGTMVQIPAGDSVVTLTGLVAQTAYDVYVRNHCGDNDVSDWLPKQTFTTMCAADNVTASNPFVEDFESYSSEDVDQALAGCWMQSSTSSKTWKVSDGESGYSYSLSPIGTYSAVLAWSADAWMYRSVHLEPGNYQLSCYAVQDSETGCSLSLGFGESFSTITEIQTQPITNGDYQLIRGEFAVASAGDYVIGIHGELTSSPYYVMVDNIRLAMVNCLTPGTPVVSEITDVSAKVSWEDTGASTYNLKVFTAKPDDVETATGIYANTGIVSAEGQLVEPLSGLTPLTTYYVYVQSVCDEDGSVSEWSNVKEFTTECSAIALSEENPYIDGFEEDSQLGCWNLTIQEEGDAGTSTYTKHSGTTAIYAYKTSAVSPQFSFAEGDNMSNYQLSGFAYASTDTLSFTVSVMKNSDREGIQSVREITLYKGEEWREFTISLAPMAVFPDVADYKYIEFNFTEEDRIYIDDLRFEVIPTCPKPADISFSAIGETSATMDWISNGSETQWRIVVKEAGAADTLKNELVSEHPYQLTGLTSNTVYEVSLRAVCVEGVDESTDVMATFKTTCGVMSLPFAENFNGLTAGIPDCWDNSEGTTTTESYKWNYDSYGYEGGCLKFNSVNNAEGNTNYLKTPTINLTSDARLKFMYKKASSTGTLAVYLSVNGAPYTDVALATDLYSSSWSEAVYDLSEYTDSEVVIVFEGISDWEYDNIYIDNVLVEEVPSCERPQSVTVAKTATEATITVTDETHSAWEYAYGLPGFDVTEAVPVAMSSNTATITGLEAGTNYELYVRSVCAEEDKSTWYGPVAFSTTALPVSLPYSCDFEGSESWTLLNGSAMNAWVIGSAVDNGGSKALYISNDGGSSHAYTFNDAASTVWAIKVFEVTEEADYTVSFDWMGVGESSYDYLAAALIPGSVELEEGSDNGLSLGSSYNTSIPEGWILLNGETRMNGSAEWQNCYSEHPLVPGMYQLVFFWKNDSYGGSNPPAAIDNVSIAKLECPTPRTAAISAVTETTAQLLFGAEGTYNVRVFESVQSAPGSSSDAVFMQENVSEETCTITGLSAGTQYYAYVQRDCGESLLSNWSEAVPFVTVCGAVALPFSEDFNGLTTGIPVCWDNEEGTTTTESYRWNYSSSGYEGGCLLFNSYSNTEGNTNYLKTPAINLTSDARLKFMYKKQSLTGTLAVYLSVDGAPYIDVALATDLNSSSWSEAVYDLSAYTGSEVVVVFEGISDYGSYNIFVDNVVVEEIPSCERPVSVKTANVTATSVDVVITDPYGSAWEAVTGVKGFNPNDEAVAVTPLSSTVGTISGSFEPDVEMDLYVRTDCGTEDGKSRWYGPVAFKFVDWSAVAGEGLGLSSEGEYPWEVINDSGTEKAQSTNVGVNNSSSDLVATFTLLEGERATLSFEYYASSEEGYYSLSDYLMMFVDPEEGFTNYDYDSSFGKKGGPSGQSGSYSISFDEPGLHTVIWRYYKSYSGADGDDLARIWNVSIDKSNFFEPENLAINAVTENSAVLSWTSSLGATGHQVCVMNVGVDTVYVNNLTSASATLESLDPNTVYKVTVRSTKGTAVGDTTVWSSPLTFRTSMVPVSSTSLPYSQNWEEASENANWALLGSTSSVNKWIISNKDVNAVMEGTGSALYVSYNDSANMYSTSAATSVYAYRSFNLAAGAYSLSFDWKANGEADYDYLRSFLVPSSIMLSAGQYSGSSSSVPEGWIALTEALADTTEWTHEDRTVILEEGGYYNLVFLWRNDGSGGAQSPAAVDNVVFDVVNCVPVSNMKVSDRGVDYIEVVWDSPLTDNFQAVCVPAGTDISTVDEASYVSVSKDTIRFEELTENSMYDIYVRSVCDEGVHSVWSSLKDVMAFAEYASLPYSCDFETVEASAWTLVNGTQTNQWHVGSAVNNGGTSALYISNDGGITHTYQTDGASSYVYAVRKFRAVEDNLYTVSFDWLCKGENRYDYMQAYIAPGDASITAGTSPSTTDWLELGNNNVNKDTWQNFAGDVELSAGNYQLVFYWRNDGSMGTPPPAAVDNVNITMLSCMYPTGVGADGITDNSARLFWSGDAGIGYEVRLDESESVATMAEPFFASTSLVDTTVSVYNLASNTEYYVAVRSICAEGDTSRWATYSFTTLCSPMDLPYNEPFDSDPMNNCWNKYSGRFTDVVSTVDLSTSTVWAYSSTSYGNMDEHMRLNIYGSSRRDWLVSPSIVIDEVAGLALRFDLSLNPYSSSGVYEPGEQADDKFIVAISTDNGRTWNRSNGRTWDNVSSDYVYDNISSEGETVVLSLSNYVGDGDTIRIAFYGESTVTGGDNYLRIDNVGISEVETVELFDSICAGSSYSDNGFTIMADELTPGMHHQFSRFEAAVAEGASDKLYNLDLYVYPDGNVIVYDTVCAGTPYTEYGFNIENPVTRIYYSPSGLFTEYGCDSTVTLHLFVPETQFNERVTICEGGSYEFAGQTLTESGTYTHTFAGMYCDSTVTLELVVLPSVTEESLTICYGDSVLFDNVWRKTSGDYTAVFENSLGCDSTVTLHLTVRDEIRYEYSGVLCAGGVYSDENFTDLTEAGDHVVTLTSVTGCDSIVTLHLAEKTIEPTSFDEEICEGEVYTFGGVEYNMTGDYPHKFESVDGCDSLVTLRLTVLPVSESEMTLELTTEELPYELKHNGETIYVVEEGTEPGTYWPEITIENGAANGCDSIINLTLTVKLGDALHLTDYEELEFWPNPIERGGKVLISADFSPAERTNLKIEVYNSIGQCVATHRPTGESLYVEDFHVSGMYLVKVTTGTGRLYVGHVIVK